ncbi:VOC family protein [Legionella maioricensis]|uniref:VOC family protein n=1 Tax=Legionella maioricensis TaxID=2896528 RepID=A0A9X2CXT9_9GAMM|nr:VOC family protein [Legionella maioricensis]MCL9682742.1 VOC family protein [Legionella maioricensis]MCL9687210.1 VOC family protein [Legionella maioricensis]
MKLTYTILYVNNVNDSVEFYQNAFGIKNRFIHESGDYAEMDTGEVTLAFCAHNLAKDIIKQKYLKASQKQLIGSQISFEPHNLKEAYETALENGAKSIIPPEVKPWGWESAILLDLDGHIVEIAKELEV